MESSDDNPSQLPASFSHPLSSRGCFTADGEVREADKADKGRDFEARLHLSDSGQAHNLSNQGSMHSKDTCVCRGDGAGWADMRM